MNLNGGIKRRFKVSQNMIGECNKYKYGYITDPKWKVDLRQTETRT